MREIEKLRSCLASLAAPPLVVSPRRTQYSMSEDSEFFTEIDVQRAGDFLLAVMLAGDERRNEFYRRVLHHYIPEVWLVDAEGARVIVSRGDAEPVVLCRGDLLAPELVPGVSIPVADIFEPVLAR